MMSVRGWILIVSLFGYIACGRLSDSGGPLNPDQANYDVYYYDLDVAIYPETRKIAGEVLMYATVLDTLHDIAIDLDDQLTVSGILLNNRTVNFAHQDGKILLHPGFPMFSGDSIVVRTRFQGRPIESSDPPWEGGFTWKKSRDGKPWFATSNQIDGPDVWWPAKDHPSDKPDSVSINITVPSGIVAVSNGKLIDESVGDSTHTFHWFVSTPISGYNVAIAGGAFDKIESPFVSVTGDSLPLQFWVLPEKTEDARRQIQEFAEHLRWFEELLGPYPFRADKYGIVHVPFLGMEHQSIIAYGADFKSTYYGFDELHHHELAHEWFGNLVTASDWSDFWLQEGFAEYLQPMYVEHLRGPASLHSAMKRKRPYVSDDFVLAPSESRTARQMYGTDIYYKGAWVLHTLRYVIGDASFRTLLRRFVYPDSSLEATSDGSASRTVSSEEFASIAERISGQDLRWFFDQYLRMPDLPVLEVRKSEENLYLSWKTESESAFPMPVDIEINGIRKRVEMPKGHTRLAIPSGSKWAVDPDNWILKEE